MKKLISAVLILTIGLIIGRAVLSVYNNIENTNTEINKLHDIILTLKEHPVEKENILIYDQKYNTAIFSYIDKYNVNTQEHKSRENHLAEISGSPCVKVDNCSSQDLIQYFESKYMLANKKSFITKLFESLNFENIFESCIAGILLIFFNDLKTYFYKKLSKIFLG